ncbi:MAG TPA: helix-turn-helix domain-containing protein [Tepidisphaeraceae bacterium]|nr:helix-turn-helix domain-containing protein [Tepidisphaeraceae bacterium]
MAELPEMISVAEAAKRLDLSPVRVRYHIKKGNLPAKQVGRSFVLDPAEVAAFKPLPPGRPKTKGKKKK